MKTFGKYFNWKIEKPHYTKEEKENLFLELAHLDELEIKFDFIDYKTTLDYVYNDEILFIQSKRIKIFVINYKDIWSVFTKRFNLTRGEIKEFTEDMIEKYFNLKGYRTSH